MNILAQKRKLMKLFLSLLSIFLFLSGCDDKKVQDKDSQTLQTKSLTDYIQEDKSKIVLTKINGESLTLDIKQKGFTFEGINKKAVLIIFFTTWCPPCIGEIPSLNNLKNKYKDDLEIIGVILEKNKNKSEIIDFLNQHNVEFALTNSPANFALAKQVGGVTSIPYMVLYDKDGEYIKHYTGAIPEEMLEVDIKKVL